MSQTAVEWFLESLFKDVMTIEEIKIDNPNLYNLYLEAKEMEKQQIKSARHSGRQDLRDNGAMYKEDEQYYNETFKSEEA